MKKVLFTVLLITLSPAAGRYVKDISACYADEKDNYKIPDVPTVAPIYFSYYNSGNQQLYIYGCVESPILTVNVIHNGVSVLSDIVFLSSAPVVYDFSGAEKGFFKVFISAGDTVLKIFDFER